jgi:oxygen-dependent protoporphyrinogen oxidase
MELFIPPRPMDGDESLGGFIRRRLGQEALEKIAEPLLSGIHVSDPDRQSLLGTFPRFRDLELKYGGLIKGMLAQRRSPAPPKDPTLPASAFISLEGGMEQLVDGLRQTLDPASLRTNSRVTTIRRDPSGGYSLTLADGSQFTADAVILATPAHVSARLLERMAPALAWQVASIRYVSTATISLGYPLSSVRRPLDGFGYIVPRRSNHGISACTWSSVKFPGRAPQDAVLLRCFAGGPGHEDLIERSDTDLMAMARRELEPLMGISGEPVLGRVFRWPQGNPQYDVGHLEQVSAMQAAAVTQPGLFLAGSAYEGVGVPDCIFQGQGAAQKAAEFLAVANPTPATTLPVLAIR